MQDVEIAKRLEALRTEMDLLSQELLRSSRSKVRNDVNVRLMDALSEDGRDRLQKDLSRIRISSLCENRERCLDIVAKTADEALASYESGDMEGALGTLASMEKMLDGISSPCGDDGCSADCRRILDDVRERIALSEKLLSIAPGEEKEAAGNVTAQDVFRSIDPLSHPARVQVLMLLQKRDMSFTEVSRELDLRTGHLQYHMKALMDAGYVQRKVNRGPFSLTLHGSVALESVMELAKKLKS